MNEMISIAATLAVSVLLAGGLYVAQKKGHFPVWNKALALVLAGVFFFAHLYQEVAVYAVVLAGVALAAH